MCSEKKVLKKKMFGKISYKFTASKKQTKVLQYSRGD